MDSTRSYTHLYTLLLNLPVVVSGDRRSLFHSDWFSAAGEDDAVLDIWTCKPHILADALNDPRGRRVDGGSEPMHILLPCCCYSKERLCCRQSTRLPMLLKITTQMIIVILIRLIVASRDTWWWNMFLFWFKKIARKIRIAEFFRIHKVRSKRLK